MRIVVKDLLPGRQYHLQFRSKNGGEVSDWSRTFSVVVSNELSKPLAPENVTLDVVGDSFHAKWNQVQFSEDGSAATDLTGYVVQFRNVDSEQTATFETTDTNFELTFNLNYASFLPLAGKVGVKVAAKNNLGILSDWSSEVIAQNPPPGPVRNLTLTGGLESIIAAWEPPANLEEDFKEYRVYVGNSPTFTISASNLVWSGVGTNAVYRTMTQADHYVKVIAYDKFDSASLEVVAGPARPRSSAAADVDAPDTPTNLDGDIDGNVLTVTWTAPANPDNDLAGYQIGYRPVGQTGWSYATASHEDTSVVIQPIERFVNYEIKIQAHDFSFNYSTWSATDTVNGEVNTAPAVPTGLQVKGAITSAMVVWNANTEEDLFGYEVQFKAGSAPVDGDPTFPTNGRNISFSENVTEDTRYYARVRAVDTQGLKSAWSAPASDTVGFVDFDVIESRLDNSITDSTVQYAVNTSETVAPTSGWSTATPTRNPGDYIWFRTVITYGDGSGSTSNPALLTGNDGAQGPQGIPGDPGDDGQSLYTWLKYADTPTSGMSDSPTGKTYMGVAYNQTTATESSNYGDYQWSLIKGADGAAGSDGKGISNTTVTYAKNTSGTAWPSSGWSGTIPSTSPGEFLWTRTITTYTDNSDSTAYSVAKHGSTGATGKGITGTTVTYQKSSSGTTEPTTWLSNIPSTSPGEFLWTRTVTTYSDSTSSEAFSVAKHGETGGQGIQGPPGDDGQSLYTWIKYAPNGNPSNAQMTDTPQSNTTHIGLAYNKTTATESSTATNYSWSLIQGPKGDTGNDGATGVSVTAVTPFYRKVTKGAAQPGQPSGTADPSGWTTTEPSYTENTELYRTERISYSNNTAAWTPVSKVASYDAAAAAMVVAITADNRVRKANVPPVVGDGANAPVGALWYEYGPATSPGTGTVLKQTYEWTGSAWQPRGIDHTFLPKVDIAEGTFGELVGNRIEADSIGALQIKTEEIAADNAFLSALTVTNANITSLEANKLTAGSGIITDMTVKSTLTLGDATTNGIIQSYGFSGTTAGFKIDKTGVIINQGSVEARTLKIQSGQNLMRPEYADFEFPDSFYNTTTLTPTNFTTTAVQGGRFNKQALSLRATATGASSLYLGATNTDYNIPVEAGKVYIVSGWFKGGPVASAVQFRIKWSTGVESTLTTSPTSIAASAAWTRFTAVTPAAPTGSVGAILRIYCSTSAVNSGFDIDGIQVEEKIGAINTPSSWNMPGTTTIDGAMIRTGEIRSNSTVIVGGTTQPMWSINTNGGMQIGSAVIRGGVVVGSSADGTGSYIQSSNYLAGASGFLLRGSDGYAEFRNLAADTIGTEHLKTGTLSADNIETGTINVSIGINSSGAITVGDLAIGGLTKIEGGANGGVKFYIPEMEDAAAEFGNNVVARAADGRVLASLDRDGVVAGEVGQFTNLSIGGEDVTERILAQRTLILMDDPGISTKGPYAEQTGYREIGFPMEAGHLYEVESFLGIRSSTSGTYFTYLHQTQGSSPAAPKVTTSANAAEIVTVSSSNTEAKARMKYFYASSTNQLARVLVSARGGGGRALEFISNVFTVKDLGLYDPLVESGRYSLGGASGTPPVEVQPPQLYKQWFDFDWDEVYQYTGKANHNVGGLGTKLRQGRVGSTATYPYATLLKLNSTAISKLSTASKIVRVGIRLTNIGYKSGNVIVGQTSTTLSSSQSSAPSTLPTPTSPTSVGTLASGATKTLYLPSSWNTRWKAGSNKGLILGRLDSNGANDAFMEFNHSSTALNVRARLYVEYEA